MRVRSGVAVADARWSFPRGWPARFLMLVVGFPLAACATPKDDFAAGADGSFGLDAGPRRDAAPASADAGSPDPEGGGPLDDASDEANEDAGALPEAGEDATVGLDAAMADDAATPPADATPPPPDGAPPGDAGACAARSCLTALECVFAGCTGGCVGFHCQ